MHKYAAHSDLEGDQEKWIYVLGANANAGLVPHPFISAGELTYGPAPLLCILTAQNVN